MEGQGLQVIRSTVYASLPYTQLAVCRPRSRRLAVCYRNVTVAGRGRSSRLLKPSSDAHTADRKCSLSGEAVLGPGLSRQLFCNGSAHFYNPAAHSFLTPRSNSTTNTTSCKVHTLAFLTRVEIYSNKSCISYLRHVDC